MRSLQLCFIATITSGMLFCETASSQDLAIVTAQRGYLFNDAGTLEAIATAAETFEIVGDSGDSYRVRTGSGRVLSIRRELVHSAAKHWQLTENEFQTVTEILQLVRQAEGAATLAEAQRFNQQAIAIAERRLPENPPVRGWLQAIQAYHLSARGESESGLELIAKAWEDLAAAGADDHLVTAEVANIEGLILQELAKYDAADKALNKALKIARRDLGNNHCDVAVYLRNRAWIRDGAERYAKAARDAEDANRIEQSIYPPNAIEHPLGLLALGKILIDNDDAFAARRTLTSALGMLRTYHPESVVSLADCQLSIAESWYSSNQRLQAERICQQIDFRLPAEASAADSAEMMEIRKSALHLLGDIDFDREDYAKALDHYMAAAELIDDDNMVSLDGWSYVYSADALDALGRSDKAQRFYKGAWLIFEKTDGPESQNAIDARQLFVDAGGIVTADSGKMSNKPNKNSTPNMQPAPPNLDGRVGDSSQTSPVANQQAVPSFMKPGEGMFETKTAAPIMSGTEVLATVPAGTRLWSLETQDTWHKVMIPQSDSYGWIAAQNIVSEHVINAKEMSKYVNDRAGSRTAAAELDKQMLEKLPKITEARISGGIAAALPLQEEVVQILEQAAGPENFMTVGMKSQLATFYFMNRQYIRSRQLIENALPALRATHGDDHPLIAKEIIRLASLLAMIGDSNGQKACLEEALQIGIRRFGPDDSRVTNLRLAVARVLIRVGLYERAEKLLDQVMQAAENQEPTDVVTLAAAKADLGSLRASQDRLPEAIELLRDVDATCAGIGDSVRGLHGNVLYALAAALRQSGETEAAIDTLEKAEERMTVNGSVSRIQKLHILGLKASLTGVQGNWNESLQLSDSAMDLSQEVFGEDSYFVAGPLVGRGRALSALGQAEKATTAFDRSRRRVHDHIINTIADLSVSSQIAFLKSNDNSILHVALSLGLTPDATPESIEASATWLLNAKNVANELAARDGQAKRLLTSDEHLGSYKRWLELRRRLATLPPLTDEEAADEQLKATESDLRQNIDTAFAELPSEAQSFLQKKRTPWVECSEIRQQLKPNEVFIDFLRMRLTIPKEASTISNVSASRREEYVAWIIPAAGRGDVQAVRLGNARELDEKVVVPYVKGIANSAAVLNELGETGALAKLSEASRKLTQNVWLSLADKLPEGTQQLTLCPDSLFWQIPWAAIETPDRKLLLEDFAIRYVSSGRDLLKEKNNVAGLSNPVVLADPDYGATADAIQEGLERLPLRSLSFSPKNLDATLLRELLPDNISRLPGTADEATAIQPLIDQHSGMKTEVFLRGAASETIFRLTQRPHTLFVGTHGFFLPEAELPQRDSTFNISASTAFGSERDAELNPLRRCGLLFAGCSDAALSSSDDQLDGIVTGAEIVTQDLRGTQLVVLSACETGLGDLTSGQGVLGLRQAIQLAGAETVVSTLWEIPDRDTRPLITGFFENLAAGMPRSEALRQAQLTRIEKRRERNGAAHPLFWAAFTVTGQD